LDDGALRSVKDTKDMISLRVADVRPGLRDQLLDVAECLLEVSGIDLWQLR
jgi:hypothetical protein